MEEEEVKYLDYEGLILYHLNLLNVLDQKVNSSDLADVATSGNYNDLINKPTDIGVFNNNVGYLTDNSDTICEILDTLEEKANLSDLESLEQIVENNELVTSAALTNLEETKANKSDLEDLELTITDNEQVIASALNNLNETKADKTKTYTREEILDLIDLLDLSKVNTEDLALIAFSGSYTDLINTPTIPPAMTILSYGNSTWQDFLNAYNSNTTVYCRASSNSNPATGNQGRMAFMTYIGGSHTNPTDVEFLYYRSVSSKTSSQQGDLVFIYKLTSAGQWSVTTRETSSKVVAGTGLSSTYSSGTLTISFNLSVLDSIIGEINNSIEELQTNKANKEDVAELKRMMEDNELVITSALCDLDSRIKELDERLKTLEPHPNNIIIYSASEKLAETTSNKNSGLHTNAFNTTIVSHTFENGVGTIEFNDDITTVGNYAFYGCSFTNIDIPNSVTRIDNFAFQNCTSLTSINIPSGVTNIVWQSFKNCTSLTSIVSNATTAPTIQVDTFQNVKTGGTLRVPSGSSGYDVWMGTGNYYLGLYGWKKIEQ